MPLFRARALRSLGLTDRPRRSWVRPSAERRAGLQILIKALRYEKAMTFLESGRKAAARAELERIYAMDPEYLDVAERLGSMEFGLWSLGFLATLVS